MSRSGAKVKGWGQVKVVPFDPARDIGVVEWENGSRTLVGRMLFTGISPSDTYSGVEAAERVVRRYLERKPESIKPLSFWRSLWDRLGEPW